MRRAANFLIPLTLITLYYALCVGAMWILIVKVPSLREFFPVGGLEELADQAADRAARDREFEPIYTTIQRTVLSPTGPARLAFASLGAAAMIVPVSWAYFITARSKEVNQSFVQTIIIMPIVVTGISMIVQNSLPLAFSLAGVVAAVRFRFTLSQPSHAMYIFVAISVGLAAGIGALGIAAVISAAFVYTTIIIWKLEYGRLTTRGFLSMLTRRDVADDDY
ncbi:MAG: DUF4956 domain-containing protein [Woeseiaceae bacterium]|nr:DUF4956 domain-containing protein [Woeseiaceae bacterium]